MEDLPSVFLNDPIYIKMREKAEIAFQHLSDEYHKNKEYERSLKKYRDSYAILTTERQEGFAEGEAKGRAEGEAILIKKLHSNGMGITEIASMTGYTPEKIERIITY